MFIDWLHQVEVVINYFIQGWGDWLKLPMQAFSFLGTENFYMFVAPALYWCVDSILGLRIGMMFLLSSGLHSILKLVFHTPRPYWVDANVKAFAAEAGFGLPSGHATTAAAVWGLFAASVRKNWLKTIFIALIFFIGFSRLFLGVHYLSDVLGGWLAGGLLLLAFIKLEKPVVRWAKHTSLAVLLAVIAAVSVFLVVLMVLLQASLSGLALPPAWGQMALTKTGEPIDPLNLEGAFTLGGTWLGLVGGAAWYFRRWGAPVTKGKPVQLLLRYALGLVGVIILWFGLGQVFPRGDDLASFLLRYLRYGLIGAWVSAIAPLLFVRLGLVKPRDSKK